MWQWLTSGFFTPCGQLGHSDTQRPRTGWPLTVRESGCARPPVVSSKPLSSATEFRDVVRHNVTAILFSVILPSDHLVIQ